LRELLAARSVPQQHLPPHDNKKRTTHTTHDTRKK
jgi:hypothetical protein